MTEREIYNELGFFLKKKNHCLQPETSLKEDLFLDSLDIAELVVHLERKFNIQIEVQDDGKLESVKDLIKFCTQSETVAPCRRLWR